MVDTPCATIKFSHLRASIPGSWNNFIQSTPASMPSPRPPTLVNSLTYGSGPRSPYDVVVAPSSPFPSPFSASNITVSFDLMRLTSAVPPNPKRNEFFYFHFQLRQHLAITLLSNENIIYLDALSQRKRFGLISVSHAK